jgi:sugar lactone lactonase YvrE
MLSVEGGGAVRNLTVLVDGLAFGEGPRWHDGRLYLSDIHDHRVLAVDADGTTTVVAAHDGPLSGLGWLPDGRLLVVAMDGLVLRLDGGEDGALTVHADVRQVATHQINDMIVHAEGWAYVGQFGYDREAGGQGTVRPSPLLRVDPDGSVHRAAEDLLVANGMALTPDGGTLLVAESAGRRVSAFTVDDEGRLADRRVWAELPPRHHPDGMCIDAEGAAWVACVTTDRCLRVAEGGEVLDEVRVAEDGRHPVACVLGGPDRRTLYLLTATTYGEAEPSLAARAGRVEQVRVDVPGAGRP